MRQIAVPKTTLRSGDTVSITFNLQLYNNIPQPITLVAVRWEPVWGTELTEAERAQLESSAFVFSGPEIT